MNELNSLLKTNKHEIKVAGTVRLKPDTMVKPKDLILMFPDGAMAELEDLASDKTQPKGVRGKARKLITIFSGSEPLDTNSDVFKALLSWAVILESFSQTDIDNINEVLGIKNA